jgi:hypothetical protein
MKKKILQTHLDSKKKLKTNKIGRIKEIVEKYKALDKQDSEQLLNTSKIKGIVICPYCEFRQVIDPPETSCRKCKKKFK